VEAYLVEAYLVEAYLVGAYLVEASAAWGLVARTAQPGSEL
jgi:hypothetical protein